MKSNRVTGVGLRVTGVGYKKREPVVRSRPPASLCLCPDKPTDEEVKMLTSSNPSFSEAQARWAWDSVSVWSETNNKRRKNWRLVTWNAMKRGWALEGFGGQRANGRFASQQPAREPPLPIDHESQRRQRDEAIASWTDEHRESFFMRNPEERERWKNREVVH